MLSNTSSRVNKQPTCTSIRRSYVLSNTSLRLNKQPSYVFRRPTYLHRIQVYGLTSNRAICQMPSPCPLTFRVSSIKHQTLIHFPSPFLYPNIPYQIPHQVHPHRPKRQSQTTNRLTNPHSICTSTPSKERVQATNNRLPTNTQSVHPLPRRGLGRLSPSYCFAPIYCKSFSQPSFFVVQGHNISCTKPSLFVNTLVL